MRENRKFLKGKEIDYYRIDREFVVFLLKNMRAINRLQRCTSTEEEKENTYFWITPWGRTPTPWYTMLLALLYQKYTGNVVTLVINDIWKENGIFPFYEEIVRLMKRVMMLLIMNKHVKVIKLSEVNARELSGEEILLLNDSIKQNTIKQLQSSKKGKEYERAYELWEKTLYPMAEKIKGLFEEERIEYIVLPGGMFEETGFLFKLSQKKKISACTFDSGLGRVKIGINCIAAQVGNTKDCYDNIMQAERRTKIIEAATKVLEARMYARQDIGDLSKGEIVQPGPCGMAESYDIVIFMNIEHDTAALGTHIFYADDSEWLLHTIEYILNNTACTVAVREHPLQRKFSNKNAFDYLHTKFGENDKFHFFSFQDKVNSYDLIQGAKVVLANTSTIGIESAMLGKCVITESSSYYADSKFVKKCTTEELYFEAITNAVKVPRSLCKEQIEEADVYYGLTQLCSNAITDFTPQNKDFFKWIRMDIQELLEYKDTKMILDCIVNKKSLIKLKFNERFE